jgi:hypothetical protein
LGSRTAAAVPFALDYEAPSGCPSREAFVGAIRERVPEAEISESATRYRFRVAIEAEGEHARAQLTLGDGVPVRHVAPAPCPDVANSMVLMIAIVLTGDRFIRLLDRSPAPNEEPLEPEVSAETPPETPPQREPPASVEGKPVSKPAEPAPARAGRAPAPSRELGSFRGGAWGAAGLAGGVAPFPAVALSGGAELELPWIAALKPSLRAGVTYASGDTSVEGYGGAEFRLIAFAGRVCPHAFSLSQRWALAVCASVELGELTASGVRTPNRRIERMPWVAVGVAPRVELALSRVVSFEGELGLRGIVRHDRFVFEPDATEVYDVPRLSPQLSFGASARFP